MADFYQPNRLRRQYQEGAEPWNGDDVIRVFDWDLTNPPFRLPDNEVYNIVIDFNPVMVYDLNARLRLHELVPTDEEVNEYVQKVLDAIRDQVQELPICQRPLYDDAGNVRYYKVWIFRAYILNNPKLTYHVIQA